MGHPGIHGFEPRFGVIGCLSVKDLASARELVEEDAKAQVRDEARAPSFTVLGAATPTTSGYPTPPAALTKDKLGFFALFNDHASYHDGEHMGRTKEFHEALTEASATGEMVDYLGGFRGECLHMERCHASGKPVYCIHGTAKAKDAECAKKFVEIIKAQLSTSLFVMRATIFPPGGDIPPEFQDQVTLHWVAQWAGSANHELHNKHCEDSGEEMRELVEDISIIEYADATHYAKAVPYKGLA